MSILEVLNGAQRLILEWNAFTWMGNTMAWAWGKLVPLMFWFHVAIYKIVHIWSPIIQTTTWWPMPHQVSRFRVRSFLHNKGWFPCRLLAHQILVDGRHTWKLTLRACQCFNTWWHRLPFGQKSFSSGIYLDVRLYWRNIAGRPRVYLIWWGWRFHFDLPTPTHMGLGLGCI